MIKALLQAYYVLIYLILTEILFLNCTPIATVI
jgi:hypothetical protein